MKKILCILASAALLGACEQKTETVTPAAPADKKTENNTTIVNPHAKSETGAKTTTNINTAPATDTKTETKTETTTSSSPNP